MCLHCNEKREQTQNRSNEQFEICHSGPSLNLNFFFGTNDFTLTTHFA